VYSDVKISNLLPMKFGIRKRLQTDKVDFRIVDSDLHIVVFNKVLIQIYNPRILVEKEDFVSELQDLAEICDLFLIVFDFIDLVEDYPREKTALKKKVNELKNRVDYQIIPIENEEELYFIIKSILESVSKESS